MTSLGQAPTPIGCMEADARVECARLCLLRAENERRNLAALGRTRPLYAGELGLIVGKWQVLPGLSGILVPQIRDLGTLAGGERVLLPAIRSLGFGHVTGVAMDYAGTHGKRAATALTPAGMRIVQQVLCAQEDAPQPPV